MGRSIVKHAGMALTVCLGCFGSAIGAELGNSFELHGYGTQDYFQASANKYLGADDRGNWDNNLIALVGTLALNQKSNFWFQLEAVMHEPVRFDWFFVDYQLNDRARLRREIHLEHAAFGAQIAGSI